MSVNPDASRLMLRHTLATLAYRGGKVVRDVPATFATFSTGEVGRQPGQILAHVGDLLRWALVIAQGHPHWHDSPAIPWDQQLARFFDELARLDAYLASEEPLAVSPEKIFQGPIADALTHVGQLAMLRRMAGVPMRGENYFVAEILAGRVGPEQAPPKREFD